METIGSWWAEQAAKGRSGRGFGSGAVQNGCPQPGAVESLWALESGPRPGVPAPHRSAQKNLRCPYPQTGNGATLQSHWPFAVRLFIRSEGEHMLMGLARAQHCPRGICSFTVPRMFFHETLLVSRLPNAGWTLTWPRRG